MPRVITKPTAEAPFVVVISMGYGLRGEHAHVAVVETDGKTEPSMISFRGRGGRGVRDIVWGSGNVYYGKTERSASSRAIARAIQIAGQHNHVYQASLGLVTITVAEIDAAENETYRRDLIEVYRDGLVGYLRDSGAQLSNATTWVSFSDVRRSATRSWPSSSNARRLAATMSCASRRR
jgi:hypothetical protein